MTKGIKIREKRARRTYKIFNPKSKKEANMQHFIEGLDNHAKRILILTDLAKEYNVSDDLVLIEIENSRGKLLARMTCEKQRLKEIVALVNNPF